jgi:hypothetical protein
MKTCCAPVINFPGERLGIDGNFQDEERERQRSEFTFFFFSSRPFRVLFPSPHPLEVIRHVVSYRKAHITPKRREIHREIIVFERRATQNKLTKRRAQMEPGSGREKANNHARRSKS